MDDFHQQFMKQKIEPIFLDKSQNAVDRHKETGDTVLVITATNSFAAALIVRAYGIEHLLPQNRKLSRDVSPATI